MTRDFIMQLHEAVVTFNEDEIDGICTRAIEGGIEPKSAILDGLAAGMRKVGELYESQEYGIPEVLLASDVLDRGMSHFQPLLSDSGSEIDCTVLIGTVEGDIHSIGKNIVKLMLDVNGFRVIDLGEDVTAQRFLDGIDQHGAHMVALSSMMTTTLAGMRGTIENVGERYPDMPVLVGGASVTEETARRFGASGYAENATKAVHAARRLAEERLRA
jgi:methanogenic corrinoid protein MtbC1